MLDTTHAQSESAPAAPAALRFEAIRKVYSDGTEALAGVDLEIRRGMVGLLGPNGAGKTTLPVLTLAQQPTSGRRDYFGLGDAPMSWPEIRRRIGYLPQEYKPVRGLSGAEYLHMCASLRGVPLARRALKRRVADLLDAVELPAHRAGLVGTGRRPGRTRPARAHPLRLVAAHSRRGRRGGHLLPFRAPLHRPGAAALGASQDRRRAAQVMVGQGSPPGPDGVDEAGTASGAGGTARSEASAGRRRATPDRRASRAADGSPGGRLRRRRPAGASDRRVGRCAESSRPRRS